MTEAKLPYQGTLEAVGGAMGSMASGCDLSTIAPKSLGAPAYLRNRQGLVSSVHGLVCGPTGLEPDTYSSS